MQGALPLGGVAAGFVLPLLSMSLIIGISATVAALPGLGGMQVKELWNSSLERDHVFD
jgi:hypothetical protein